MRSLFLALFLFTGFVVKAEVTPPTIRIGSKIFAESYILAEIMAQVLEEKGFKIERKMGLGGTLVAFEALRNRQIDLYPEYTGTLSEVILKKRDKTYVEDLQSELTPLGIKIFPSFGFNNTYAVAVPKLKAQEESWTRISDLRGLKLKAAFTHEFFNRQDGWLQLKREYHLAFKVQTVEHSLAYEAIRTDNADVIVAYSTDGKVEKLNLKILKDDKSFFPEYLAVPLGLNTLPVEAQKALKNLEDLLDENEMRRLNSLVEEGNSDFTSVAHSFLVAKGLVKASKEDTTKRWQSVLGRIGHLTLEHIYLVFISTLGAILVALPLGILLFRFQKLAPPVLSLVGLLQTIPSLALLVYMIPWLGVSTEAALMALFLYSLLPILQNTYSGLVSVDPQLIQAARGIGLYPREILFKVQLPLALPIIVAGVRIATVINVGTATIAAFIGSGGLGELIVQGLSLNNIELMQQGAIPAALLAIATNILFTRLEKKLG